MSAVVEFDLSLECFSVHIITGWVESSFLRHTRGDMHGASIFITSLNSLDFYKLGQCRSYCMHCEVTTSSFYFSRGSYCVHCNITTSSFYFSRGSFRSYCVHCNITTSSFYFSRGSYCVHCNITTSSFYFSRGSFRSYCVQCNITTSSSYFSRGSFRSYCVHCDIVTSGFRVFFSCMLHLGAIAMTCIQL